ncbi:hypothetical protein PUNSTDRAFT_46008 [Punctularia strigosozonata HHB-11173 SS5]|uniref:uncharacterized protein n=1 Tax=Punctularia strigosozonata (strain HHB-11173) TaxID=741275 RepID=UPI0004417531|nr:uncharacterized protein PUNSTDRAFT_46008 [Punctularia strigosozonata HHB-11173 SS5]EIN06520.1 hypothetical protein PUNSTDRAFT_46008 [Punctularia strigosozonata HHB-11173 SS5]
MDNSSFYANDQLSYSPDPSQSNQASSSKLKLILPPLKGGKLGKGGKKARKGSLVQDVTPKAPRAVKLKPLKEVLTRIITQIKKKDDYAFFLQPVDVAAVPGYADLIKHPMDLGTISHKVSRGKYRTLEEFKADFQLVTTNAKTFNPPGTIYHSEAERIENYGLDQINRASTTVIEYETDWNLDIEGDGEPQDMMDDEDDTATGRASDDGLTRETRSPSVVSTPMMGGTTSRPQRIQMAHSTQSQNQPLKEQPTIGSSIAAGLDEDGHLPGYRDGLDAFPPGSDFAQLMSALRRHGKRYKTKKERLRIEKDGLPHLPDGSLDYWNIEDPFTLFTDLVPEPFSVPDLVPLFPTSIDSPPEQTLPIPTLLPPSHAVPPIEVFQKPGKRKHWTIHRGGSRRHKDTTEPEETSQAILRFRPPEHTDFGVMAELPMQLAEETGVDPKALKSQESLLQTLRDSLARSQGTPETSSNHGSWSPTTSHQAEGYIRDVVYGGPDGYAYMRSLAEFVGDAPVDGRPYALGMPLSQWVEKSIVDPLTNGHHGILREVSDLLLRDINPHGSSSVEIQLARSLILYPRLFEQLLALRTLAAERIDMAALIRSPDELIVSAKEWVGKAYIQAQMNDAGSQAKPSNDETSHNEAPISDGKFVVIDGPKVLEYTLQWVAQKMTERLRRKVGISNVKKEDTDGDVQMGDAPTIGKSDVPADTASEDPEIRKLRINLLALAQYAPLDQIAQIPESLVPAQLRNFVPTVAEPSAPPDGPT